MAQRVITELIDDVDGSTAHETVTFGLDGTAYEVDLSEKNAKELRDALAVFIAGARRVSGTKRRSRGSGSSGPSISAQVREWATQNGYEVPSRGRIPAAVMEAYHDVHGGSASSRSQAEATMAAITANSPDLQKAVAEVADKPKARKTRKPKPVVEPVG